MVLTPSGLVLTNNHVIDGATEISVQIASTVPPHPAHVVGYDIVDDVALLQMEGVSGLKTVVLGDSAVVAVEDPVVTIGNALGEPGPHAVTTGKGRRTRPIDHGQRPGRWLLPRPSAASSRSTPGCAPATRVVPWSTPPARSSVSTRWSSVGGRRLNRASVGYAIPIVHALGHRPPDPSRHRVRSPSTSAIGAILGIQGRRCHAARRARRTSRGSQQRRPGGRCGHPTRHRHHVDRQSPDHLR